MSGRNDEAKERFAFLDPMVLTPPAQKERAANRASFSSVQHRMLKSHMLSELHHARAGSISEPGIWHAAVALPPVGRGCTWSSQDERSVKPSPPFKTPRPSNARAHSNSLGTDPCPPRERGLRFHSVAIACFAAAPRSSTSRAIFISAKRAACANPHLLSAG